MRRLPSMPLWEGAPYDDSRSADGLVFTAGACPLDETGALVAPAVVAEERRELVPVWDVSSRVLGRAPSTLLGVSLLGYPGQLVAIKAVVAAG